MMLNLTGGNAGLAQIVPEGQPFDNPVNMGIQSGVVNFQFLTASTTYTWRARTYCSAGGNSDWSPVYTFTTPPPCPSVPLMPFDTVITLTFPAPQDPNIGYRNCGSLTSGEGYVFRFPAPANATYRLSIVAATGGGIRTGFSYNYPNFCRGNLDCLSPNSEAGEYSDLSVGVGDEIVLAFSTPPGGVVATRSVQLSYRPCQPPTDVGINLIQPHLTKGYWSGSLWANSVDVEMVPATETFTGTPNYPDIPVFEKKVTFENLTPGKDYRWQIRSNCGVNLSPWVEIPGFTTSYPCDSIPVLVCDSVYIGFKSGYGRQKMLRYRPSSTHELILHIHPPEDNYSQGINVAMRDSALGDCFSDDLPVDFWPQFAYLSNSEQFFSLGSVQAGHTYYIYANKGTVDSINTTIQWYCLPPCARPNALNASISSDTSAFLSWNNGVSDDWELALTTDSLSMPDEPQFSGTGNTFELTGLTRPGLYFWRVRNICPNGSPGNWSKIKRIILWPDCSGLPEAVCNTTINITNSATPDFFQVCDLQTNSTERYGEHFYRFTVPYEGIYSLEATGLPAYGYMIKEFSYDCNFEGDWTCLGHGYFDHNWSIGLLQAGKTYLIAADLRSPDQINNVMASFNIVCPTPCPAPTGLSSGSLNLTSASLSWSHLPSQSEWEIEIQPAGLPFTGNPNYTISQDTLAVSSLTPNSSYQWRVRANCGPQGNGDWSATAYFDTPFDCGIYPALECGQEIVEDFEAGTGIWSDLTNCSGSLTGKIHIRSFTTDASTRYVYVPGGQLGYSFFLKNAVSGDCLSPDGWQCIGPVTGNSILPITGLIPGDTYFLLIKKQTATAGSLRMSLQCAPCVSPATPQTNLLAATGNVRIQWDGANGPWTHEIVLHFPDGSEQTHNVANWSATGHNLASWFNLDAAGVYSWRVRTLCNNGDTSNWTSFDRFKILPCTGAVPLPCNDTLPMTATGSDQYLYFDICTGTQAIGQQEQYRLIVPSGGGIVSLHLLPPGNTPLHYALSSMFSTNCSGVNWNTCGTISSDSLLSLGTLATGKYLLLLSTADTALFNPLIGTYCPCPGVTQGSGVLYSGGTAILSWSSSGNSDSRELEIVPAGTPFTGMPNYFTNETTLSIDGLDVSHNYKFRVRNRCGSIQTGAWSAAFPIDLLVDCTNIPTLPCGDTLALVFASGTGLLNTPFCSVNAPGREGFFKITPSFSGLYSLNILDVSGLSTDLVLGILDSCGAPDSAIECIGHGGIGNYSLGVLQAGQTYDILADAKATTGGNFLIKLDCQLYNDEPWPLLNNPDMAYVITIGDTCRWFENHNATTSTVDGDPSQAPGIWYDGPEHSVWLAFIAPPGGTVQITAHSDTTDILDPQLALYDTATASVTGFVLLATGEDNTGQSPDDAVLTYTGLTPGAIYYLMVDGANGTMGRFCLTISEEPSLWSTIGVCQDFQQSPFWGDVNSWHNLYADGSDHVSGTLLGAIKTTENLGLVTLSVEILPQAPVLPNGQKLLPRYFRLDTEFPPQDTLLLRLFFNAADLEAFNLMPPVSANTPFELDLTHYDGDNEDCDPSNNALAGGLSVGASQTMLVGINGTFYLEAEFDSLSEFGASVPQSLEVKAPMPDVGTILAVFPNPFNVTLNLHLYNPVRGEFDLQITDIFGKLVRSQNLVVQAGETVMPVDLSEVASGLYQLALYREGIPIGTVRIVKLDGTD